MSRAIRCLVAVALVFGACLAGCSGGSGPPGSSEVTPVGTPTPLAVELRLDASRAATATVGTAGGAVEAVAADGTRYRLDVPPSALLDDREITLTPITDMAGLPAGTTFLVGVHFAPEGLSFLTPATLTVESAASFPAAVVPIGFRGDGQEVHLQLVQVDGTRLTYRVSHFSGIGAVMGDPEALAQFPPGSPMALLTGYVGQTIEQQEGGITDAGVAQIQQAFLDYWTLVLQPRLQAANTDELLEAAIQDYASWRALITSTESYLPPGQALNSAQLAQARDLIVQKLQESLARIGSEMEAANSWEPALQVVRWLIVTESLLLATPDNGLEAETMFRALPLRIVFESVQFPSILDGFHQGDLDIQAGVKIGNHPISYTDALRVDVDLIGAIPETTRSTTDAGAFRLENYALDELFSEARGSVRLSLPQLHALVSSVATFRSEGLLSVRLSGPTSVVHGGQATFTTSVTRGRAPLRSVPVSWSVSGSGAVTAPVSSTNINGNATMVYTAPAAGAGPVTITVDHRSGSPEQSAQESLQFALGSGQAPPAVGVSGTWNGTHSGRFMNDRGTITRGSPGPITLHLSATGTEAGTPVTGTMELGVSIYYLIYGSVADNGFGAGVTWQENGPITSWSVGAQISAEGQLVGTFTQSFAGGFARYEFTCSRPTAP